MGLGFALLRAEFLLTTTYYLVVVLLQTTCVLCHPTREDGGSAWESGEPLCGIGPPA
jgi:hypothetical protein